jgi:hypothetical protein
MTTEGEKKRQLTAFLDEKAFDPVLNISSDEFSSEEQKRKFHVVRKSMLSEKRRFHDRYTSAKDIKENYLGGLDSRTSKRMYDELEELGLPSLPKLKDEFIRLCDTLGV